MRVVVSGGTGFVGQAVLAAFSEAHPEAELSYLTRTRSARADEAHLRATPIHWAPHAPLDASDNTHLPAALSGADAVIHLAGEPAVGRRLTAQRKQAIMTSRVESTELLVQAMARAPVPPSAFVCGSGVGYYGPRDGAERLTEAAHAGDDFLAEVCARWEAAAEEASSLGVRVVRARLGIVFGAGGGALDAMALPIRLFAGGRLGSGTQVVSWIHLDDAARAFVMAATNSALSGAVNIVAPAPSTNAVITGAIGRLLRRPTPFAVPHFALRAVFGDGADALTTGQYVVPEKLLGVGFEFRYPTLDGALRQALGKD